MKTGLLSFTLLLILFTLPALTRAQAPTFVLEKRVGVEVNSPEDVAVDSEGNIYFASSTVTKFNYHEFLGTVFIDYAPEGLNAENYGTFNITLDKHDNLYVVSKTFSKVVKFNKEGKKLLEFGLEGERPGQFKNPEEIAVNSKDEIYVADSGNKRIQRFDKTGKLLQIIPLEVSDGRYLEAPLSIDFDATDNLYLLHNPANKVVKYNPLGKKILEFGNNASDTIKLENPWKLAVDKKTGHVIISDISLKGFYIYNLQGELHLYIAHNTGWPKLSGTKLSIAVTPDELFVIADNRPNGDSQILRYTKGGEGFYRWGNHWQTEELTMDEEGSVYLLETSGRITKFNADGEVAENFGRVSNAVVSSEKGIDVIVKASKAIASDIFNNIYVLSSPNSSSETTAIHKFDKDGKPLARFTDFGPSGGSHKLTDLAVDANGNMFVSDFDGGVIYKIDSKGRYIGSVGNPGYEPGQIWMPLAVAVDRTGILHVLDYNGSRIQQFDSSGKLIRQFGKFSRNDGTLISNSDMAVDGNGNVYVASNLHQSQFLIFNSKGELLHEELNRKIDHIAVDQRGSRLITNDYQADGYSQYKATDYINPQSIIKGLVYADVNKNCKYDQGESTLPGVAVMATPGPHYAITGDDGSYTLAIAPGDYTLHTILPTQTGRTITASCPLPAQGHAVTINATGQLVQDVNFGNQATLSPLLSVSVSSDRRRRCFDSTTKLTYSNTGYGPANNAKVYLQLPEQVDLLSADKPYKRLPNGTYMFEAGTVVAGQTSVITIQDKVVCGDESIRGMTVCTKAWITPGNQTTTTPPAPVISITGTCNPETGKVRFVIKNTGQVGMEEHEQFRKYINGLLSTVEDYRLVAGDSMVFWVPAGGRTVRLEADQPDGNGDNTMASATVEACTTVATPTAFSTGFVNAMPTDDEEAEVAEECLPIIDSFDPNDKLVLPVGRTEENYTPTGAALKYKIRFQNTGTDVAYRVVVVDTLSEHLDLSTLQIGSASHAYRYELSGKGKPVLTWTFDNILLPDSTTNEAGSHGYIQFSIKPKPDLPEKSAVENYADIFFDYNSPVRTNITINRIYDMPLVIDETVRMNLEQIIATPAISSFVPAAGKYGTEVRLSGKRFSATAASNKVYFNGVLAPVVSASETELRVLVPTNTSTGAVKVETPDGVANTQDLFEVYQPPILSSFSPAEGIVGATVTLQGTQLGTGLIESIKLGTQACDIISNTGDVLVVRVPAEAVTAKFEIVTKGGNTKSTAEYVVWHQPSISSLSKTTDAVGATITLAGAHFAPAADRNRVLFGNVQAQVLNATTALLTVKVPVGAVSGSITVETPGGKASSTASFEVIPAPLFVAMAPSKGSVGTEVEITGANFGTLGVQDEIHFNGEKAQILEASDARYSVRVPRGASSGKVKITGYGGMAYSTTDFVVEELTPAQAIEVYPNPTTGHFTISFLHADFDVQAVQVYNSVGKLAHTTTIKVSQPEKLEVKFTLDKAGLYMLHIMTERGIVIKKLIVL